MGHEASEEERRQSAETMASIWICHDCDREFQFGRINMRGLCPYCGSMKAGRKSETKQ